MSRLQIIPWVALTILMAALVCCDNHRDFEVVRVLTRSEMQAMFEEAMKTRGGHLTQSRASENNLVAAEQSKLSSCKFGINCENSKETLCKTVDCEKPSGNEISNGLSSRRWRGLLITG